VAGYLVSPVIPPFFCRDDLLPDLTNDAKGAKGTGDNEGNRAASEEFPRLSLARPQSPFGVAARCSANLISFRISASVHSVTFCSKEWLRLYVHHRPG